jgi:GAF domain-containing protein
VSSLAAQAAVAIENASVFEEVRRKSAQLAKLNAINRKLISPFDLGSILEASKELVGGYYTVIYLYGEAQDKLIPHAKSLARFAHGVDFPPFQLGEGLCGHVARARAPLILAHPQNDPRRVSAPWNRDLTLGEFAACRWCPGTPCSASSRSTPWRRTT